MYYRTKVCICQYILFKNIYFFLVSCYNPIYSIDKNNNKTNILTKKEIKDGRENSKTLYSMETF